MEPSELERQVSQDLRRLPDPTAPATLLPRVMLAVRARAARPWYQRAWWTWPKAWQYASAAAALALVASIGLFMPIVQESVAGVSMPRLAGITEWLAARTAGVRVIGETLGVLWRAVVQPFAGYLIVALAVMWAACATFSVALSRVAFGEAVES